MQLKGLSLVAGALMLAAGNTSGAELKLKWESGKRYVFSEEMSSAMTMKMGGMAMATQSEMKQQIHYDVAPHEKGQEVKMSVASIKMNVAMNGQEMMAFDSTQKDGGGAFDAMLKPLLNLKANVIYDKDGKVLEVTGLDDLQGLDQVGMGKKEIEQMARQASLLLPGRKVKQGEQWTAELNLPLGQLSKEPATLKMQMTFEGMEKKDGKNLAKIAMTGGVNLGEGDELPFDLTSKKIEGTMLFDVDLGQPRETMMEMEMELGLPEGTPVEEGALEKMPMTVKSVQTLKSVE